VTAELFATVRRRRPERALREGGVDRVDCPLHRGRATVRDRQGEVEPALALDERRDGPDGHPELQIGLYFHAFGCGKMGVAHSDSSV